MRHAVIVAVRTHERAEGVRKPDPDGVKRGCGLTMVREYERQIEIDLTDPSESPTCGSVWSVHPTRRVVHCPVLDIRPAGTTTPRGYVRFVSTGLVDESGTRKDPNGRISELGEGRADIKRHGA